MSFHLLCTTGTLMSWCEWCRLRLQALDPHEDGCPRTSRPEVGDDPEDPTWGRNDLHPLPYLTPNRPLFPRSSGRPRLVRKEIQTGSPIPGPDRTPQESPHPSVLPMSQNGTVGTGRDGGRTGGRIQTPTVTGSLESPPSTSDPTSLPHRGSPSRDLYPGTRRTPVVVLCTLGYLPLPPWYRFVY